MRDDEDEEEATLVADRAAVERAEATRIDVRRRGFQDDEDTATDPEGGQPTEVFVQRVGQAAEDDDEDDGARTTVARRYQAPDPAPTRRVNPPPAAGRAPSPGEPRARPLPLAAAKPEQALVTRLPAAREGSSPELDPRPRRPSVPPPAQGEHTELLPRELPARPRSVPPEPARASSPPAAPGVAAPHALQTTVPLAPQQRPLGHRPLSGAAPPQQAQPDNVRVMPQVAAPFPPPKQQTKGSLILAKAGPTPPFVITYLVACGALTLLGMAALAWLKLNHYF